MPMTDNIDWMRKNRGIKGSKTKHSAIREKTQKHGAMSELFIRKNSDTAGEQETQEQRKINTRSQHPQ